MGNLYTRSTDGNNADSGATWALAKATGAGAAAIDAAGDTIWFSQVHSESITSAASWALAGTATNPTRLLCGNDAAEPPTALTTGALISIDASVDLNIGGWGYINGLEFRTTAAYAGRPLLISGGIYENCFVNISSTNQNSYPYCGISSGITTFKNCTYKFGNVNQKITHAAQCTLFYEGGSVVAGGTSPDYLFSGGNGSNITVTGFDASNCSAGVSLSPGGGYTGNILFYGCKLPASWTGQLAPSAGEGVYIEMVNCDGGDTHYRYRNRTKAGETRDETTLVKTGSTTDGTTNVSYKMTTGTSVSYPITVHRSIALAQWNDTVGSSVTATVDILHDSTTNLKDDEIWLEVWYLGTSGVPLATMISDAKSDVLATATDQATSTATWTTTGMTNPNKQKLSVTFTPQEAGMVIGIVKMAKASKTVYHDEMVLA